MSKSITGRLAELALIASRGAQIVYAGTGFVSPNRWISNEVIRDFTERGLIECSQNRATVTDKGNRVLAEKKD